MKNTIKGPCQAWRILPRKIFKLDIGIKHWNMSQQKGKETPRRRITVTSSFKLYVSVSSGEKGGGEGPPCVPQDSRRIFKDEVNGFFSVAIFFMFTPHTQMLKYLMTTSPFILLLCLWQHVIKTAYLWTKLNMISLSLRTLSLVRKCRI